MPRAFTFQFNWPWVGPKHHIFESSLGGFNVQPGLRNALPFPLPVSCQLLDQVVKYPSLLQPVNRQLPEQLALALPTWLSRRLPAPPLQAPLSGWALTLCGYKHSCSLQIHIQCAPVPISFSLNSLVPVLPCKCSRIFFFLEIAKFLPQENTRTSLGSVLIWLLKWLTAALELSKGPAQGLAADVRETGD